MISFNNIILFGVSEKSHFGFFVFGFGLSIFDSLGVFHNIVKNHFLLSILYQVKVLIFQDIFFLFGFIFNIFFSLFSAYRSYRISSRLGGKFLFILCLVVIIVVFLKLFSQVSSRWPDSNFFIQVKVADSFKLCIKSKFLFFEWNKVRVKSLSVVQVFSNRVKFNKSVFKFFKVVEFL